VPGLDGPAHGNDASTHLSWEETMKHYLSSTLHVLGSRRGGHHQWSRLERDLTSDRHPDEDTGEMRRYLAAQTSQTV
jgi:hypothetical protein